ncbi:MAG: hypothetical protein ACOX07_05655 [Methanobacterium sp.]
MTENNEKLVFLEKENDEFNVNLKPFNELENSNADLVFAMDEKSIGEIFSDPTTEKLSELLFNRKIEVYGLKDHLDLKNKGYIAFLNNLGLSINGGCSCD